LVDPCLTKNTEGVQGGLSGNAGGLGFLVRSELLDQGLISCITSVSSSGFYGKESVCFVEIKVGTSTVKWVNAYIRSRGGAEEKCYEWDKVQTVLKIKGNKMIMGDINASIVYSRPTELWRKEGLGFTTAQSNATIKRTAKRLREELAQASITDISARGEHIWVPTRCPVGGPNNKLDVIMVSDALMKTQKARLESIITPTAEPDDDGGDSEPLVISDHKMLIMTMRANCSLTVGAYKEKETYKLQRLLNSHRIQRIFKERMSVQAAKSMDNMDQGESLDSINCMLTQGIKECAVSTVGVKSFRKASSQRIITSKPDVARARRDLADSRREVKSAAEEADQLKKETLRMGKISDEGRREEKARILRQLDEKSVYRQKQANLKSKKLRNQYIKSVRVAKEANHKRDISKVKCMTDAEKSKFLHSRIKRSVVAKTEANSVATYATMTFEGRRAVANTPEQIKTLLNSYTYYVSMNTEDTERTDQVDKLTKKKVASFSKGEVRVDEFDALHKKEVDARVDMIRAEIQEEIKDGGSRTGMNKPFTMKELEAAIKRLKAKLWKACGLDGVHNWMLYFAGKEFHSMLLRLYNRC